MKRGVNRLPGADGCEVARTIGGFGSGKVLFHHEDTKTQREGHEELIPCTISNGGKVMRLATIVLIASSFLGLTRTAAAGPLAPVGLRVEHLRNPIGIDVVKPRFSWELQHTARGQAQTAYQITIM